MSPRDRYDVSTLPEAQFEPGSRHRVLKNLLGVKRRRVQEKNYETVRIFQLF